MGLFASKRIAGEDANPLGTAETDVRRLSDAQRDLAEQLDAARTDAKTRRDAHRLALVEEPDKAARLGELALAARMKVEGLEANATDLDADLAEARVRLAGAQEAKTRADAVGVLLAAMDEFQAAYKTALPAMTHLIEAARALGKAQQVDHVSAAEIAADHLAQVLEPFPRETDALWAAAERRVTEWRQPPKARQPQHIEPQPLGPPVPGSARPRPHGARW
jgi:hypothetical protein